MSLKRRRPNIAATRIPFNAVSGESCRIEAAAGDEKKMGSFAGNAYTGAVMEHLGWWGRMIIDLDGVRVPKQQRPVLRQHDHQQIVGHTEDVKVEKDGIKIAGVLSGEKQHTDTVTVLAKNGFQWELSIGADPVRTEYLEAGETTTVNGREVIGPLTISRETELGEISFVPLGADGNTSATVQASKRGIRAMYFKNMLKAAKANGNLKAAKYSDDQIEKMSDTEAKAALRECMAEDKVDADDDSDVDADDDSDVNADGDDSDVEADDDPPSDDDKKAKAAKKNRQQSGRGPGRLTASQKAVRQLRSVTATEMRRQNEIAARCQKYGGNLKLEIDGKEVDLIPHAIKAGWSPDKVELHALRQDRPKFGGGPHLHIPNRPGMTAAVLEAAVMQAASPTEFRLFDSSFYEFNKDRGSSVPGYLASRIKSELAARYPDQVMQAAHTHFRGRIGLQQMLVEAARSNGYHGPEVLRDDGDVEGVLRAANWSRQRIEAEGASNYSLQNLLANVLNKFLLGGYLFTEQSWRDFAAIRPMKDFKPSKSVNLFGDFIYDTVGTTGELKNASLSDQAFSNVVDQYGRIMTIGRKAIINDDISGLTTVPMLMGRGAGLKLLKEFYTVFLNPGNADDGNPFWNNSTGTHGAAPAGQQAAGANSQSGGTTTLTSDGLKAAIILFNKQVDPAGFPLGVDAELLLYPPELDVAARELMNAQFLVYGGGSASKQPNTNVWAGRFKPVMSRYLSNTAFTGNSTTAWYLLASPGLFPVIECAFLNGVDVPMVQQAGPDFQFDRLGISIRGVFDFGVNIQNFRGGVKSVGA